jgi:FkbM family methyltransferase
MGYRGDILSFEPIPRAYAALAHRMRGDRQWTGQQLAIGDSPGEATLNVMAETVFSSFLNRVSSNVNPSDTVQERLTVKVGTLAHIIDAMNLAPRLQYTLLKSDTQGHDMAVLQGSRRVPSRN